LLVARHSDLGDSRVSLLRQSSGFQRRSFSASCRGSYSRSGPVLHSSSILLVSRLFAGWGVIGSTDVFLLFLWGLTATSTACSSSACRRASFIVFSPLAAVEFLCRGLLPRMRKL
jgi:hypothetical protein